MNPEKVYLPPLDIKLGLIKNLPGSDTEIKAGVFVGPQKRELIQDIKF